MIIGIVGSRRRNSPEDKAILYQKLIDLMMENDVKEKEEVKIVTGDCDEGGDKFARNLENLGYDVDVKRIRDPLTNEILIFNNHRHFDYYVLCNIFYKRNEEIAKEPLDYLLALVAKDRTGGTENTIKLFKRYHPNWEFKLIII